jgi:DNA-binding NarL/FixJ family response regulator
MAISILIAEDDALLRSLMEEVLRRHEDFHVLQAVGNGREALERVEELRPSVLLLDLNLPELSGFRVLEQLVERGDAPRVLVLSGDEADETQVKAASYGAVGFVGKSQAVMHLPAAIRAAARGEAWFSRQLSAQVFGAYSRLLHRVRQQERPVNLLSEREKEVLIQVARGLTNQQIAESLFMSISTVKTHIQNIFQKLDLPNRTEAAVFAVREGLVAEEPRQQTR